MSLRHKEIAEVVAELRSRIAGAAVQKAFAPREGFCCLELRARSDAGWRSAFVVFSAEPELLRIAVAPERPASPGEAAPFQRWVRQELSGARLASLDLDEGDRIVRARFDAEKGERTLVAELTPPSGALVLLAGDRVLASTGHVGEARGLRPGAQYAPPPPGLSKEALEQPSRLSPGADPDFPLASAAEGLHAEKERALRLQAIRRRLLAPIKARRSRLARTVEKVRAEASRQPEADEHKRVGELIAQNAHRIPRGATRAKLTEYTAEGPREVEVELSGRPARDEAEGHFQKYRRLSRGTQAAGARLAQLEREAEEAALEQERIEALPEEELLAQAPPAPAPRREKEQPRSLPYKVFRSASGEAIWVGKGARENDALTFHSARPQDLWLHARGVPGSHVVVPLERGRELPQELLLDAAHLAVHHSQAKGEAAVEVSYTPVKFVRKQKGGAPGAVSYTREKTFLVRVQPDRLERLLKTREP